MASLMTGSPVLVRISLWLYRSKVELHNVASLVDVDAMQRSFFHYSSISQIREGESDASDGRRGSDSFASMIFDKSSPRCEPLRLFRRQIPSPNADLAWR